MPFLHLTNAPCQPTARVPRAGSKSTPEYAPAGAILDTLSGGRAWSQLGFNLVGGFLQVLAVHSDEPSLATYAEFDEDGAHRFAAALRVAIESGAATHLRTSGPSGDAAVTVSRLRPLSKAHRERLTEELVTVTIRTGCAGEINSASLTVGYMRRMLDLVVALLEQDAFAETPVAQRAEHTGEMAVAA